MLRNLIVLPDGTELFSGPGTYNAVQSTTITQSVNSGTELTLGSVCATALEMKLITPKGNLNLAAGDEITLYKVPDSGDWVKVGLFTLETPGRPSMNTYKITAYDRVSWLDRDLSTWFDALDGWPYTLHTLAQMKNELNHVAIITDGNGRWAARRGLPRSEGHTEGRKKLDEIWGWCLERGIRYLSCYVLSLDNLGRDEAEVEHIHRLARDLCNDDGIKRAVDKGIRLVFCGDRTRNNPEDREAFERAERETAACDRLTVMLQSYYGGRDEIVKAANRCIADGVEITEDNISARLYGSAHHTEPDLVIRTGGYQRLSGYLPWESVYSELYFTPTLFPDLSREEFLWACKWFEGIHRTYGGDREPVAKNATTTKGAPFARKGAGNGEK